MAEEGEVRSRTLCNLTCQSGLPSKLLGGREREGGEKVGSQISQNQQGSPYRAPLIWVYMLSGPVLFG